MAVRGWGRIIAGKFRKAAMEKNNYKNLVVWQRGIDLVPKVYGLLKRFPNKKEFLQHLSIAKGSLAELHTLPIVAERLGYLDKLLLEEMEREMAEIARPLSGLISSLNRP